MNINEKLSEDMKAYMKDKKEGKLSEALIVTVNVYLAEISILKSKLAAAEKEKKAPLNELEQYKILKKELDDNDETLSEATKGGRGDIQQECMYKYLIITKYMERLKPFIPEQLSGEEIVEEINKYAEELRAGDNSRVFTKKETGLFMKELKVRLAGKADMKEVSKILATILS